MASLRAASSALALCLVTALTAAQSSPDLAKQVARGVADLSRSRIKQVPSGEWLRERLEVEPIVQGVEPSTALGPVTGVVSARIVVYRSANVPESTVRSESLPMTARGRRYEVQMRFAPDAAYGQWVFVGGRYWILDDQGQRQIELAMFPDLLLDAPLDAPHELAWAIMSP